MTDINKVNWTVLTEQLNYFYRTLRVDPTLEKLLGADPNADSAAVRHC